MSHKLIKFIGNWGDEFDLYGFSVKKDEKWDKIFMSLMNADQNIEIDNIYFGTNQRMYWDNTKDFLEDLEVISITDEEADTIQKLFGERYFGYTFIDSVLDKIN